MREPLLGGLPPRRSHVDAYARAVGVADPTSAPPRWLPGVGSSGERESRARHRDLLVAQARLALQRASAAMSEWSAVLRDVGVELGPLGRHRLETTMQRHVGEQFQRAMQLLDGARDGLANQELEPVLVHFVATTDGTVAERDGADRAASALLRPPASNAFWVWVDPTILENMRVGVDGNPETLSIRAAAGAFVCCRASPPSLRLPPVDHARCLLCEAVTSSGPEARGGNDDGGVGTVIDVRASAARSGPRPIREPGVPATDGAGWRPSPLVAKLTRRELEIIRLLASGASTATITDRLTLSPHTIRNHIRNILRKLQAHSKLEAVLVATRAGIVNVDQPAAVGRT